MPKIMISLIVYIEYMVYQKRTEERKKKFIRKQNGFGVERFKGRLVCKQENGNLLLQTRVTKIVIIIICDIEVI